MTKAIFLDKDGTIVDNRMCPPIIPTYDLLESVVEGLLYLQRLGFRLIIISNQSWVGKGMMSVDAVESVFQKLLMLLLEQGITISGYYYCVHVSSDNCECRKPKPGLIFQAAAAHGIDLSCSYFIGDMEKDVLAGKSAGLKTVLVGDKSIGVTPDFIIRDLNQISEVICYEHIE